MEMLSLDDLVPKDHLVRKIEAAIDWSFIYDLVKPLYCDDNGCPSLDPVALIKLPVLHTCSVSAACAGRYRKHRPTRPIAGFLVSGGRTRYSISPRSAIAEVGLFFCST